MKKPAHTRQPWLELNARQMPSKTARETSICFQSTTEEGGALSAMKWWNSESTPQTHQSLSLYPMGNETLELGTHR